MGNVANGRLDILFCWQSSPVHHDHYTTWLSLKRREIMAKTKIKPGPKAKYREREEIHVLIPVDDLN
jgi:hypothetical protein